MNKLGLSLMVALMCAAFVVFGVMTVNGAHESDVGSGISPPAQVSQNPTPIQISPPAQISPNPAQVSP